MFNLKITILKSDGNNIKPDIQINTPEPNVRIGRSHYARYLAFINKIPRFAVISAGAGLDLNKYHRIILKNHQIQLLVTAPPVPVHYEITVLFKISGGDILALMP